MPGKIHIDRRDHELALFIYQSPFLILLDFCQSVLKWVRLLKNRGDCQFTAFVDIAPFTRHDRIERRRIDDVFRIYSSKSLGKIKRKIKITGESSFAFFVDKEVTIVLYYFGKALAEFDRYLIDCRNNLVSLQIHKPVAHPRIRYCFIRNRKRTESFFEPVC